MKPGWVLTWQSDRLLQLLLLSLNITLLEVGGRRQKSVIEQNFVDARRNKLENLEAEKKINSSENQN